MIVTDPTKLLTDSYVALDFEATNIDKGDPRNPDNKLVLACWTAVNGTHREEKQVYGSMFEMNELLDDIAAADMLVAQNAKYEMMWLVRMGVNLRNLFVYDTMLGDYVLGSNRKWSLDLDSLAKRRGLPTKNDLIKRLIKGGVCPSTIPVSLLIKYCKVDTYLAEEVMLQQRRELLAAGSLGVMLTRCLLTPVLTDIEMRGVFLDKQRVLDEWTKQHDELLRLDDMVNQVTGGINMNSPKQKAEFLYDELKFKQATDRRGNPKTTPTGLRMTKTEFVLANLKPSNKRQRQFLELLQTYSKVSARLSKTLDFFKGVVEENDGLFYANLNQTVTATQRLSSTGKPMEFEQFDKAKSAQLQNMPREYKNLVCSRHKDWRTPAADGAQLEFRVAGFLGQDTTAYEDIINGVDVHSFTAETLSEGGQPTDRQGAKAHTFKPLYGGQSGTNAERGYYAAFREKYPGITGAQQQWIDEALLTQKVAMPWGLTYYYPGTRITSSGYIENTTSICNYPVQGLATAEIIPIAMIYMWHYLEPYETFLVNTVHDSVVAESPPNEEELFNEVVVQSFTHDVYHYLNQVYNMQFNFPLGVGIKHANHWDDTKDELKITPDPMFQFREAA